MGNFKKSFIVYIILALINILINCISLKGGELAVINSDNMVLFENIIRIYFYIEVILVTLLVFFMTIENETIAAKDNDRCLIYAIIYMLSYSYVFFKVDVSVFIALSLGALKLIFFLSLLFMLAKTYQSDRLKKYAIIITIYNTLGVLMLINLFDKWVFPEELIEISPIIYDIILYIFLVVFMVRALSLNKRFGKHGYNGDIVKNKRKLDNDEIYLNDDDRPINKSY